MSDSASSAAVATGTAKAEAAERAIVRKRASSTLSQGSTSQLSGISSRDSRASARYSNGSLHEPSSTESMRTAHSRHRTLQVPQNNTPKHLPPPPPSNPVSPLSSQLLTPRQENSQISTFPGPSYQPLLPSQRSPTSARSSFQPPILPQPSSGAPSLASRHSSASDSQHPSRNASLASRNSGSIEVAPLSLPRQNYDKAISIPGVSLSEMSPATARRLGYSLEQILVPKPLDPQKYTVEKTVWGPFHQYFLDHVLEKWIQENYGYQGPSRHFDYIQVEELKKYDPAFNDHEGQGQQTNARQCEARQDFYQNCALAIYMKKEYERRKIFNSLPTSISEQIEWRSKMREEQKAEDERHKKWILGRQGQGINLFSEIQRRRKYPGWPEKVILPSGLFRMKMAPLVEKKQTIVRFNSVTRLSRNPLTQNIGSSR